MKSVLLCTFDCTNYYKITLITSVQFHLWFSNFVGLSIVPRSIINLLKNVIKLYKSISGPIFICYLAKNLLFEKENISIALNENHFIVIE